MMIPLYEICFIDIMLVMSGSSFISYNIVYILFIAYNITTTYDVLFSFIYSFMFNYVFMFTHIKFIVSVVWWLCIQHTYFQREMLWVRIHFQLRMDHDVHTAVSITSCPQQLELPLPYCFKHGIV